MKMKKDGISFMGASGLQERKTEAAKSPNANPFGLVYDGAITKNEAGILGISQSE